MDRLSLRARILLATFVPLVVFALLAGGIGAYALRRIPEDLVLERQTALAQVAAAGVAGTLRGYVRLLEVTAADLAALTDDPARQQLLTSRESGLAVFTGGAGLVDARGTAVAVSARAAGSLGLNFAELPYFQDVKTNLAPTFSAVFRDEPTGEPSVMLAVPVRRGGAFAGALLGEFRLSRPEWARDLNLLRTPQGGGAYLIDSASTIIYHPDPSRVQANIQAEPELWRLVIGGQPGSALYRPPATGQLMIVTYTPIPGLPWGLMVEEPWEEVLSSIAAYEGISAGVLAVGILLAMVALLVSVSRVTRPLRGLVAAGQRVAAGKEYVTLPLEGPPDLRIVIQAINRMADHLGAQQAALRHYARQVVDGQEDERLRISRDLHDETVQELVGLNQRIELCADALEKRDAEEARRRLREVQTIAHRALRDVRRVSQNLRPSILEDLGLVAALHVLVRDLGEQMPGAHASCEVLGEPVRLPHDLELTAFRIAQEALNNVRKHAQAANRVNVVLAFAPWGATLVVEDNGSGFALADGESLVRAGHLGLAGMAERARLFGGDVGVTSSPGEGTTVTLRLPLSEDQALPLLVEDEAQPSSLARAEPAP